MISHFKKEFAAIDRSSGQLRSFGLIVGGIVLAIGGWFEYMGGGAHVAVFAVGGGLVLLGLLLPRILLLPYLLWMGLALVLGMIVSPVVFALLYYIFLTPIGILMRIFRKPAPKDPVSYWIPREKGWTKESMEKLF